MEQVVFSSECYTVLAYPQQNSYEVVDKIGKRTAWITGAAARRFREETRELYSQDDNANDIDEFIEDQFSGLMLHDCTMH